MNIRITAAVIAVTGLCACSNQQPEDAHPTSLSDKPLNAERPTLQVSAEIIDPVCGMVKDSTWTDFWATDNDTVWFCSEIEKKAYIANPKKYQK